MKTKIGILNFQHSNHNYGAVLQAAALEHFLKGMNFEVEHVNVVPLEEKRTLKLKFRNFIGNILRQLNIKKQGSFPKVYDSLVFENFRLKWINRSEEIFNHPTELTLVKNKYMAVIVGSDQVWRPDYTRQFYKSYFLDFCGENTKRISYAASFGKDKWSNQDLITDVKIELNKFDFISVRENSGVDICKEFFDVKATHVLDPTLLVGRSFFEKIISNASLKTETKFSEIVFYKLSIEDEFLNQVNLISEKMNCAFENIYYFKENNKFKYNNVEDWLLKIKSSKLVITDSFHCVCFSILFEKEFLYYANESKGMTRLESLLEKLELSDRICCSPKDLYKMQTSSIDYAKVHKKLDLLRQHSESFLISSLSSKDE
ncbi:MAG: hypothetical protein ACI9OE_002113 [Mariniflexile sp.]|jgi:hypothetical protein